MKQTVASLMMGACVVLAAQGAMAEQVVEFQLDEADMSPAAGGMDDADIDAANDPNSELFRGDVEGAPETAMKPMPEPVAPTPPTVVEKPAAVPVAKPEKTAKPKAPEPRDIPLIETENANTSHEDVTFVTGGIGDDEKQSIEASKGDYNLHVMSASTSGAFVGDARVVITRKVGKETEEMLNVAAGPLLYVRLPTGTYTLEATLGEQKKRQTFSVSKKGKAARVHLGWKVAATAAN